MDLSRLFFCCVMGFMAAVIPWFFEPAVGTFVFLIVSGFSWQITEPKPERGETSDLVKRLEKRQRTFKA